MPSSHLPGISQLQAETHKHNFTHFLIEQRCENRSYFGHSLALCNVQGPAGAPTDGESTATPRMQFKGLWRCVFAASPVEGWDWNTTTCRFFMFLTRSAGLCPSTSGHGECAALLWWQTAGEPRRWESLSASVFLLFLGVKRSQKGQIYIGGEGWWSSGVRSGCLRSHRSAQLLPQGKELKYLDWSIIPSSNRICLSQLVSITVLTWNCGLDVFPVLFQWTRRLIQSSPPLQKGAADLNVSFFHW